MGTEQVVDPKNRESYQLCDHAPQNPVKSYGVVDFLGSLLSIAVERIDLPDMIYVGSHVKVYL